MTRAHAVQETQEPDALPGPVDAKNPTTRAFGFAEKTRSTLAHRISETPDVRP